MRRTNDRQYVQQPRRMSLTKKFIAIQIWRPTFLSFATAWKARTTNEQTKNEPKGTTLAGLEPTRDKPNRFLVDRLNRSATASTLLPRAQMHYIKFYL